LLVTELLPRMAPANSGLGAVLLCLLLLLLLLFELMVNLAALATAVVHAIS
jgi:hypothetical protein